MASQLGAPRHRRGRRGGIVAAVAVSALVGGSIAVVSATASASPVAPSAAAGTLGALGPQRVGAAPHAPLGAVRVAAPAGDTSLHLSVNLAPRNPDEVRALAAAVSQQGNPLYHHYLSKGQFGQLYGATPQTVAAVDAELRAEGLAPGAVSSDRLSIPVDTTLAQAGQAFHTAFAGYRLKGGGTGYLNQSAPQFSGAVAADITGVTGLNATFHPTDDAVVQPRSARAHTAAAAVAGGSRKAQAATAATGGPALCGTASTALSQGFPGTSDGNGWYSAQNLASVYGMDHTATSGSGVTVGVAEWEQYSPSDLATYQACYGTKVPVSVVKVDGGATAPPVNTIVNNVPVVIGLESLLDMEDIAGLAPGASIIDYQGPSNIESNGSYNPNFTDDSWMDPLRRMVTDDNAQVLSISYGACEIDQVGASPIASEENWTFLEAALQGQTVLTSSGDDGAEGCTNDQGATYQNSKIVEDPASQPGVTSVGGTSLSGSGASANRTSWADGSGASGGGTSEIWSFDSAHNYQKGFTGAGYSAAACKAPSGSACRQVPDVSALADPATGYAIYAFGSWIPAGGTSGAAPTWAALVAQADTQGNCASDGPAGFINPSLYKAATSNYAGTFTDITASGSGSSSTPAYAAGKGYDLSTGLGEPNAPAVINAICRAKPMAATGPGTYHPVTPTRLLDTRSSQTTAPQVAAGNSASVQIEGNTAAKIPATGVTAVVLNVTVVHTTGNGVLTAWGDGTTRPKTSNLNWVKGDVISNLVTVPLSGDGWVDLYTTSATDIVADVQGYYTDDTTGIPYVVHQPQRLLDTRYAKGVSTRTKISNTSVNVQVTGGVSGIPATAQAVVLNVTATQTVGGGFVSAYPTGMSVPNVSNINWAASNTTLPGLVVVPIGTNGQVSLYVHGTAHVIADVFGYFDPSGSLDYTKSGPKRLLDTRNATGVTTRTPIPAGGTVHLQVTGGNTGVPVGASAVVLNITVTGSSNSGVLTAYPDGTARPGSSNLNWFGGQTVPNLVVVPVGQDGTVDLYVNSTTHVVADVFGYFDRA